MSRQKTMRIPPLGWTFLALLPLGSAFHLSATRSSTLVVQSTTLDTDFESMTVKELKNVLTESGLNERGLLSKLKKKQDLVDFLSENLTTMDEKEALVDDIENDESQHSDTQTAVPPSVDFDSLPTTLRERLHRRDVMALLPIQSKSFQHVRKGNDAVIHAPTGSGYVMWTIPLTLLHFPLLTCWFLAKP